MNRFMNRYFMYNFLQEFLTNDYWFLGTEFLANITMSKLYLLSNLLKIYVHLKSSKDLTEMLLMIC